MSSATSTKGQTADEGFRISHFFVLLSLIAATVAVVMARPAAPENLVLLSLTIGAAGLAAVAFYRTVAPLVSAASDEEREPLNARLRADLEREKALTLRSIKELEFDRAMGKVSDQDFQQMAGRLRARAMGIMKQLDLGVSVYRQQIEHDLASRLGTRPAGTPDVNASVTTAAGSEKGRKGGEVRPAGSSVTCVCGTANDPDARFCKSCGVRLREGRA
jgi:hypothetical protein